MPITVQVRVGGLMRCCDASIDEDAQLRDEQPKEGETMNCKWCKSPIRFHDGMWEWHRDEALKGEPWHHR